MNKDILLKQQIYCPSFIARQEHRKNPNEHNINIICLSTQLKITSPLRHRQFGITQHPINRRDFSRMYLVLFTDQETSD